MASTPEELQEMNRQVAERVFGWQRIEDEYGSAGPPPHGEGFDHLILRYSTDIAAAWTVIRHYADFWGTTVRIEEDTIYEAPSRRWVAILTACVNDDGDTDDFEGEGPTVEVAICRAGLALAEWGNQNEQSAPPETQQ